MKIGFSQSSVLHVRGPLPTHFPIALHEAIRTNSAWDYACLKTPGGYFLKPTFRDMPYRNSFVPEISISLSQNGDVTTLEITGQPVEAIRIFTWLWLAGTFLLQLLLLVFVAFSGTEEVFPLFIPSIMCVFGYLLCHFATKFTFRSVVSAITKAFP